VNDAEKIRNVVRPPSGLGNVRFELRLVRSQLDHLHGQDFATNVPKNIGPVRADPEPKLRSLYSTTTCEARTQTRKRYTE
jgi:hypothetical protein